MSGDDPDVFDFDAFRAERTPETLPIKVGGKRWDVPASPPASAVLDAARVQRSKDPTITTQALFELAEGILGPQFEDIMRAGNLGVDELLTLIGVVSAKQSKHVAPPPNREARRAQKRQSRSTSSKAGQSSRRTSSASTRSTSSRR